MEVKFSELKFDFKDITEPKSSQLILQLEINDDKFSVPFKSSVRLTCLEIQVNTVLSISLIKANKFIGTHQISFASLFGENLQGKVDRWLKLRTDDGSKLQIKFFAALNVPDKTVRRVPSQSSNSRNRDVEAKCPYLAVEPLDLEALNELWKQRGNNANSIKLAFEPPDSPADHEVDLKDLSQGKLASLPGPQLKQVVKALCTEISKLESIAGKLPELKLQLEGKLEERRLVEKTSKIELERIKEKWMTQRISALELLEKRKVLKSALNEKQDFLRRLEAEVDILKVFQGDLNRERLLIETQKMQFDDCEAAKSELSGFLDKSEGKKKDLELRLKRAEAENKIFYMKNEEELKELRSGNDLIKERIKAVEEELKSAQASNKELKQKVSNLHGQSQVTERLKDLQESSKMNLKSQEKSRDSLNSSMQNFLKELEAESKSVFSKTDSLISKKSGLSSDYLALSKALEQSESEILDTQKSIFDQKAQKTLNEQVCCVRADLHSLNSDISVLKDFYKRSQNQILPDLLQGSSQLLNESQKVLALAEQLDRMIESIDKKEEEMESLKGNLAQEHKRHVVHVPVKGDPVDLALAEFVNSKEVPVRFARQDGGNYLFGSTKVFIKLENSRLLVKVKGGFTTVEEFLSLYLPVEVQRGLSPVAGVVRMHRTRSPDLVGKKVQGVFDSFSRSPKKQ